VRSRGAGRRREEREARTAERAGGPMEREWHTWVISWKKKLVDIKILAY
jgi:hypothetical protein